VYRGILTFVIITTLSSSFVWAQEPIMITSSPFMEEIIFDGKWTHRTEWKASSLNTIPENSSTIFLRSAHQGNFVYFLIDAVFDTNLDKGSDRAIICFDTQNDKTEIPDNNDFCFVATLGRNSGSTLQGGSPLIFTSNFKNIKNHDDFIGISGYSDENDRYSKTPHASYEFRIPTDLISRSNVYGFYVGVYDYDSGKIYSWPENIVVEHPLNIPSPSLWGELVSPDKSLPEFELPILALIPAFLVSFLVKKYGKAILAKSKIC